MAQSQAGAAQPVPALFFSGVERRYPQREGALEILRGADFAIWPGELVALVAPSGAGKSTIARKLLADEPELGMSVSVTTRPMRPGCRCASRSVIPSPRLPVH